MTITLTIHDSWRAHPGPLSRLLAHLAALEAPAPWTPPATREPGQDDDDGLVELLAGMDDTPEPAPAPAAPAPAPARPSPVYRLPAVSAGEEPAPAPARPSPAPAAATPPAARRFDGEPMTGQSLYKWACNAKCLPRVNAYGKARGWHKLVTHWDADQVATAYRELTAAEPVVNGRPR
jgi:hypothetical protein